MNGLVWLTVRFSVSLFVCFSARPVGNNGIDMNVVDTHLIRGSIIKTNMLIQCLFIHISLQPCVWISLFFIMKDFYSFFFFAFSLICSKWERRILSWWISWKKCHISRMLPGKTKLLGSGEKQWIIHFRIVSFCSSLVMNVISHTFPYTHIHLVLHSLIHPSFHSLMLAAAALRSFSNPPIDELNRAITVNEQLPKLCTYPAGFHIYRVGRTF